MREKFIEIYTENIQRAGADHLLNWLKNSDFFKAPASTRYHGAFEGGLVKHSVHVYEMLEHATIEISAETRAVIALIHDLCKVDFYKTDTRNVKNEQTGMWEKVPYYTVEDQLPFGHGEKSVYIINSFIRLTREEAMAINWHMGGFDDRVKGGNFSLSTVFTQYPLALELHIADMRASFIAEKS